MFTSDEYYYNIHRLSAIIEPQESIQWEPEEAIVVSHVFFLNSVTYCFFYYTYTILSFVRFYWTTAVQWTVQYIQSTLTINTCTCTLNKIRLPNLRRIDAAKELFNAFATRTQAYKLHLYLIITLKLD